MYFRYNQLALVIVVLFVYVDAVRPSQQFFRNVGTEPPLPGIYQYFWEVNVSCSRIQHGDLSEDRSPDLSLRTDDPPLGHRASSVIVVVLSNLLK